MRGTIAGVLIGLVIAATAAAQVTPAPTEHPSYPAIKALADRERACAAEMVQHKAQLDRLQAVVFLA